MSLEVATTAFPQIDLRLKISTASIISSAPATISSSIGRMRMPPTSRAVSGSGEGNFRSSRPQTFSATFLKMMPSAMVAMIHPYSDLIFTAGRTPRRSTTAPRAKPKTRTSGIISQ